jgi:hypothetical protein
MPHALQPLTFLLATAPFQLGAQVDPTQEDCAASDQAPLAIFSDAGFIAKKAVMHFQQQRMGNKALQQLSRDIAEAAIEAAGTMSLKALSTTIASMMACLPPYSWVFTVATICHKFYINTRHVKQRDYTFVAPVAGHYQLSVWIPGDWLRPRSTVVVHSIDANATLQYRYDQQNSSDRTETIELDLPAGLTQVSVSVGRGTLLTHTAGHLVQATLENSAIGDNINIVRNLPTTGSADPALFDFGSLGEAPNLSETGAYYSIPWVPSIIEALPKVLEDQNLPPFAA